MQIGSNYNTAIQQLQSHVPLRILQQYEKNPAFQKAAPMPYANDLEITDKAETLMACLAFYLSSVESDPNLFFKMGDIVPIPDIHGDFVHLISTLHRHGLLNSELDLKREFNYVFLGDFYNRGKDADIVDCWLNKQIDNEITIYRIAGNHELFFLARDEHGKLRFKLRNPKTGEKYPIPSYDIDNDIENNYLLTEELLKNIKDGSLLAAYTSLDRENNIPKLYAHTFTTNNDFKKLGLDESNLISFVESANERFKILGADSYQRFMDSKNKGKFDWQEIAQPLFSEPLFNIFYRDKNQRVDAFFMRVTGLNDKLKIVSKISDEIPEGVYQVVGHTRVRDFDLPDGFPTNKPLILPDEESKAFVQFTDIGMGSYYDQKKIDRPDIIINPKIT